MTRRDVLREAYLVVRFCVLLPVWVLTRLTLKTLRPETVRTILVIRHDRIGDMVLTTPLFQVLRRAFPKARIIVLGSRVNAAVIEQHPCVDEVLVYEDEAQLRRLGRCRKIDLAIDAYYTYLLRPAWHTVLSGARYRLGFEEAGREVCFNLRGPRKGKPQHMVDQLLDLVRSLGFEVREKQPSLYLSDEERRWARDLLVREGMDSGSVKVAFHPGAYYPSQRWPLERFIELGRRLLDRAPQARLLVFGGPKETGLLEKARQGLSDPRVRVFSGLGIRQFMALLSFCSVSVCNNSGALHISCGLGVPTVSWLGPADPVLWRPHGPRDILVGKQAPCQPCYKDVCGPHTCLLDITVDDVWGALKKQLAVPPGTP